MPTFSSFLFTVKRVKKNSEMTDAEKGRSELLYSYLDGGKLFFTLISTDRANDSN